MYFYLFNIEKYKNINIVISHSFIRINNLKKKKSKKILLYKHKNTLIFFSKNKFLLNFFFSLFRNLLWSLTSGSTIFLKILGLGYKAVLDDNIKNLLIFDLGYSHEIFFPIPDKFDVKIAGVRKNLIKLQGQYLHEIKNLGFIIKKLRNVNVYKGKGIFFFDEKLTLKEGKKLNV